MTQETLGDKYAPIPDTTGEVAALLEVGVNVERTAFVNRLMAFSGYALIGPSQMNGQLTAPWFGDVWDLQTKARAVKWLP